MHMDKVKIVSNPTIKKEEIGVKLTKEVKKYRGVSMPEKELVILTDGLAKNPISKEQRAVVDLILNADSAKLRRVNPSKDIGSVFYYSRWPNNLLVYSQRKQNKPTAYLRNNNLVLFDGVEELPLVSLNELKSKQKRDVFWALFTIGTGFVAGLSLHLIRKLTKEISFK